MRTHERGSSSLEFIVIALGVLLPVLAISVSTSAIQRAQFATTQIARQGARDAALSPSTASIGHRVLSVSRITLDDFGIDDTARVRVECSPGSCRRRGALVRVFVTVDVPIAMLPTLPGLERLTRIPVTASASFRRPLTVVP